MPIKRFKNLDDTEETCWSSAGSRELLARIRTVWALAEKLSPRRFPAGVYKHRTIEEHNRQSEAWESMHIRAVKR